MALYGSAEAGSYLEILAPAMPLLYLESMVDGAMKGIGEQKASFRYSVWDSILRIIGVIALLPRFGMKGFLFVILLSSLYTCLSNTRHLLRAAQVKADWMGWLAGPALSALAACLAGWGLRQGLETPAAGGPAQPAGGGLRRQRRDGGRLSGGRLDAGAGGGNPGGLGQPQRAPEGKSESSGHRPIN